jgi:hypothetical protein
VAVTNRFNPPSALIGEQRICHDRHSA